MSKTKTNSKTSCLGIMGAIIIKFANYIPGSIPHLNSRLEPMDPTGLWRGIRAQKKNEERSSLMLNFHTTNLHKIADALSLIEQYSEQRGAVIKSITINYEGGQQL